MAWREALVVHPDAGEAQRLIRALEPLGVSAKHAPDPDAASFALSKSEVHAIIAAPGINAQMTERMARAAREANDSLQTIASCNVDQAGKLSPGIWTAVVISPPPAKAIVSLLESPPPREKERAELLSALYEITMLGKEISALGDLARRIAEAFGASNCLLWGFEADGSDAESYSAGPWSPQTGALCERSLVLASPVFTAHEAGKGAYRGVIARPLNAPGGTRLGALSLVFEESPRFDIVHLEALDLLTTRLGRELSWMSAHRRLISEDERLRESALVDNLTGAWKPAALEQLMASEIAAASRRGEALSLVVINVNGMRQINDRWGHQAGDAVLAQLGRSVRANVRTSDLIGRIGGDVLAVVLLGASSEVAGPVTEKLLNAITGVAIHRDGARIEIRVTGGLTCIGPKEARGEAAIARAIGAVVTARKSGALFAVVEPDPASDGSDEVGQVVGEIGVATRTTLGGMYTIRHELSRGAMGVVYRAEDLSLGREVAIKVLRSDLARDRELVQRFQGEAAILASLHHPNLVQVYSFGTEGDEVYFVMELVEGQSLLDVLERLEDENEQLDLEIVSKLADEIADALDTMHDVSLIHRDVKPANILLDSINERMVLVDVGVAKHRDAQGEAAGTPGFAAPESFTEEAETPATDAYGLAATAYTALTGVAPFGSGPVLEVIQRQLYEPLTPPSELRPALTDAVDRVLLKALAPRQADRYDSAGAFAVAFSSALSRVPTESSTRRSQAVQLRLRHERESAPIASSHLGNTSARMGMLATIAHGDTEELPSQLGYTRGVFFRVAYKLLCHHLGESWTRRLAETDPRFSTVLNPRLPPMSWQPVEQLIALLDRMSSDYEAPTRMADALGRATIKATLARVFGADPTSLAPASLLAAATSFWPRYHTWGQLEVTHVDSGCDVLVASQPDHELLGCMVSGSLARIAELGGALEVEVSRTTPNLYAIRWAADL